MGPTGNGNASVIQAKDGWIILIDDDSITKEWDLYNVHIRD